MKYKSVGSSSRTPFKHGLLNSELGRLAGVMWLKAIGKGNGRYVPCTNPLVIFDMCAGDGSVSDYSENSSPAIIVNHVRKLEEKGLTSIVHFIEKNDHIFTMLRRNAEEFSIPFTVYEEGSSLPYRENGANIVLNNRNARDVNLNKLLTVYPTSAYFIHCDPNHIDELPMSEEFICSMNEYSTYLLTLGCNVGGLKRTPFEERKEWMRFLELLQDTLYRRHDLLLTEVVKDSSQWAYLLRIPTKWSEETQVKIRKNGDIVFSKKEAERLSLGSSYPIHGVNVASFNRNPGEFAEILDRLFLTSDDRKMGRRL